MSFESWPNQIILIGRTKCGKTSFFFKLLEKYKNEFDIVYVFTTTKFEYVKYVPEKNIMDYDKLYLMDQFVKPNEMLKKKRRLIVIDNYIGVANLNRTIQGLFTQGRHNGISILVISQYIKEIPPVIRTNASHIFCFKNVPNDFAHLYDYQDKFHSKKEFLSYMMDNTQDYDPVLIKNYVDMSGESESVEKYYIQ